MVNIQEHQLIAIGMAKDEPGIILEYRALYSIEQQQLILVVFRYISFTRRLGAISYISDPPRQNQLVPHDRRDPSSVQH